MIYILLSILIYFFLIGINDGYMETNFKYKVVTITYIIGYFVGCYLSDKLYRECCGKI